MYKGEHILQFLVWFGLLSIIIFDYIALQLIGIKVEYGYILQAIIFVFAFLLIAVALRINSVRGISGNKSGAMDELLKGLSYVFESVCCFGIFTVYSSILSYIISASNHPFIDNYLLNFDKLLGFNVLDFVAIVDRSKYINFVLENSYWSFFQVPLLFVLLSIFKKHSRIYSMLLCCIISVIICFMIAAALPATSIYKFMNIDINVYKNTNVISGYWHVDDLLKMRSGEMKILKLTDLKGIITFPSFHSTTAVILMWASSVLGRIKWFFIILNILMLFSIPITGGHYLADLIAGVLIGIVTIYFVQKIENTDNNRVLPS